MSGSHSMGIGRLKDTLYCLGWNNSEYSDAFNLYLSEREARVLHLRLGIWDGHTKTYSEIGLEIGKSRERIRQIEAKALRKLRHPSRRSPRGIREDFIGIKGV